jgi:putative endonuclease
MNSDPKDFGKECEELAAEILISKGYEILARNYTYGKGEIDIIARDTAADYLVFIEVKSKKNLEYGEPEYSVTKNKISQVKRIARAYLFENELSEISCRFDVVTVLKKYGEAPLVNHYINAFE